MTPIRKPPLVAKDFPRNQAYRLSFAPARSIRGTLTLPAKPVGLAGMHHAMTIRLLLSPLVMFLALLTMLRPLPGQRLQLHPGPSALRIHFPYQ